MIGACLFFVSSLRTFDQEAPIRKLINGCCSGFWSFDLSSATDRFPLTFQEAVRKCLFNKVVAFSWIHSGLRVNVFSAPNGLKGAPKFIKFCAGQPLGFLSSWPLFALCHHILVWIAAELLYPGKRFKDYALLGDDIVIADKAVANRYLQYLKTIGVEVSLAKTLVSSSGAAEFAKQFLVKGLSVDCSPISVKALLSCHNPYLFMGYWQ